MESTSGQKEELFLDVDVDFRSLTAKSAVADGHSQRSDPQEQIAATSEQFIAELSSSFNGIKDSFIEALLPKSIFQCKQAHFVYF